LPIKDTRDYLWTIRDTMARVSEVNRLTREDVNLEKRYAVLYTRKKRGGHLTPRKVPMTQKLYEVLSRRFVERDKTKPWVFWHTYRSRKSGQKHEGPYKVRPKLMKPLYKKAGVPYFRFHAIRHSGASIMDTSGVPLGAIQRILGHENRKTTEIYLHSFGEAEKVAISNYDCARQNSQPTLTQDKVK
jgi:integrase